MERIYPLAIGFLFIFFQLGYSQNASLNMINLGNWTDHNLPYYNGIIYNDIWGYTDAFGNEYAIVGSAEKVHFLNISNPANPVEVASFSGGASSIWRDMKTYGQYAYSVADQGSEGLMIFDLSGLPFTVTKTFQSNTYFNKAHNIYIDTDNGRLYVAGYSPGPGNILVFDLTVNPANPVLLGSPNLNGGYIHDVYVRDHIAYCSHGNSGLYVYNIQNATTPIELGNLTGYINSGYNHSSWLNEAGNTLVFCDETHGRKVKAIDVTDLTDMSVTNNNLFYSNLLNFDPVGSIAHNPMIKGDLAYISYYHDGVQVFDISDINNVTRVAYYDTYPDNSGYGGYAGNWGIYVFPNSETIITSDDIYGLAVLQLQSPLPIALKNFEAKKSGNRQVEISWKTSSEESNSHFEIQRSEDGKVFSKIGKVSGAGNSTQEINYSFIDENPLNGMNYYRLKQVDFNGLSTLSEIRSLEFFTTEPVVIYPTLAREGDPVTIKWGKAFLNHSTNLKLVDASGKLIRQIVLDKNDLHYEMKTDQLAEGMYYIILEDGDQNKYSGQIFISD